MKSSFFVISWKDLGKGVIVAFLTAALTAVLTILQAGAMPSVAELQSAGLLGLTAAAAYLLKNFLTNSEDQFLKREPGSTGGQITGQQSAFYFLAAPFAGGLWTIPVGTFVLAVILFILARAGYKNPDSKYGQFRGAEWFSVMLVIATIGITWYMIREA